MSQKFLTVFGTVSYQIYCTTEVKDQWKFERIFGNIDKICLILKFNFG